MNQPENKFLVTFDGRLICNSHDAAESLRMAVEAVVSVWSIDAGKIKRESVRVEPLGENHVIVDADQLLELQKKAGAK